LTSIYAQSYTLNIRANDSINSSIIESLNYVEKHHAKENIINEIDVFSKKLALKGYINNNYSLSQNDTIFNCEFYLNNKIDNVLIYYQRNVIKEKLLKKISATYNDTVFEIQTDRIEFALNSIINHFENNGASFTNASLVNLKQHDDKIIAELDLNISPQRIINQIVIKGYDQFPKKYIKQHLGLKRKSIFNLNTIKAVHASLNTIPFISQLKKPEVLFTKDSTSLYIYVEKKALSSFDGIIGFSNQQNTNKLVFNGFLNLNLNNLFNKGESFGLNWKNNGDDTETLHLKIENPYLFNTKFSTLGEFSILKQDSSFVNTKSLLQVNFNINKRNSINTIYSNEKSNTTSNANTLFNISEFKSTFIGLSFNHKILNNTKNINQHLNFEYLRGERINNSTKNNQEKIKLSAECLFELNQKQSILLKNKSELLIGNNLFQNELFRIGGVNSIRGFDEQSIFTSKYSISNVEYQYYTNKETFLYSITDIGIIQDDLLDKASLLFGVGLGYSITSPNSVLNISYAIGKNEGASFNVKNSRIHIKITYPF
jgi:outer membrane protein assembly factor BamA